MSVKLMLAPGSATPSPHMDTKQTIIGWLEHVDLPEWGVTGLVAKIDTGAKTSAIHVENINLLEDETLEFDVVLSRNRPDKSVRVKTPYVRRTIVKSSSGTRQNRFVVETMMVMGHVEKRIQISLVSRKRMMRRMLIGRLALDGTFLVDVSKTHILE
jgi:hypothetical protein